MTRATGLTGQALTLREVSGPIERITLNGDLARYARHGLINPAAMSPVPSGWTPRDSAIAAGDRFGPFERSNISADTESICGIRMTPCTRAESVADRVAAMRRRGQSARIASRRARRWNV